MIRYRSSCDECDWTSNLCRGEKQAQYAWRKHSCDRQRSRKAAAERRRARMAAIDRTPKPCLHQRTTHVHGTHACYTLDRCKCWPCVRANTAYENQRKRLHAYGRWNGLVDAEPARQHVRTLMASGIGWKRVASLAGVPVDNVCKLIYGAPGRTPSKRIRPASSDALLAVTAGRDSLAEGSCVDPAGTRRRLRALIALGWSQSKLAARLGMTGANLGTLIRGDSAVQKRTADKVVVLYAQLSMTLPPQVTHHEKVAAARSRNYAKKRGWLPPLAYDDGDLDAPEGQPAAIHQDDDAGGDYLDHAAIERRIAGDRVRITKTEAAEVVHRMRAAGRSWNDIETITGLKPDRYLDARQEAA